MNKYLSIITLNALNVNTFYAPIKRHRAAEWIRKPALHIYCLQETHLRTKDLHRLKVKGQKKNILSKWTEKNTRVAILIPDKIDFKKKGLKKRHRRTLHNTEGKIHQEDINSVNIYAPKYIRKILEDFKKDIDSNTIIVGDFNTPLSIMDRSSKQNINKDIAALNNVLDQMDLTTYIEPFMPQKQNTHSFQMHKEHFQRQTT